MSHTAKITLSVLLAAILFAMPALILNKEPEKEPVSLAVLGPPETTTTIFPEPYVPPTTTTQPPPPPPPAPKRTVKPKTSRTETRVTSAPKPAPSGDVWEKLAHCESTMNQRATSASGKYLGYFQFALSTWRSVGGPGDPRDHSYEVQKSYAIKLQARSGWGQWPRCSQRLGLR